LQNRSGNFAKLIAIRCASSRVSNLAARFNRNGRRKSRVAIKRRADQGPVAVRPILRRAAGLNKNGGAAGQRLGMAAVAATLIMWPSGLVACSAVFGGHDGAVTEFARARYSKGSEQSLSSSFQNSPDRFLER
jgi:hypothetical protein